MSNYTKTTNFATKDNLSSGNPLKIVKGTEIDTEFNNIATAVGTKTDNASAAITGGSITGITDLAVADGGTGASTATAALNNLLPSQTSNANKYLQTDGTNASWDAVSLSTSDITGTLPVANGGTGVTTSTGTGNVVLSNSPTLVTPALGTPSALVGTNITGTASGLTAGNVTTNANLTGGVTSVGNATTVVTNANLTGAVTSVGNATSLGSFSSANLLAALTDETGTGSAVFATSPTLVTPALGTPSALVGTNITGTASGLTAGNVTTNANLTGAITSTGNATSLGSFSSANLLGALTDETGTGSAVFATSPTLVTPILGTPTSATLTNATGLPIATGVSGLGTGVATALAVNVGSSGAPLVNGGVLGTPSSGTATNLTGLPLSTGVTGTLPVANGGTGQTSYTDGQLLIGNSTGNTLTKATLTAGTNVTITNAAGAITIASSGGSTSPGGSTTQIQYNSSGAFAGSANLTFDGTNLVVGGSTTATGFIPSGSTVVTNGLYLPAANTLALSTNSTERMRIDSTGQVGIGSSTAAGQSIRSAKAITGSVNSYGFINAGTVQSDVTSNAYYFRSSVATAASAFTLTGLSHYSTIQGTIGSGSTVTNQYGYLADSSLTGATNNYGFFGNIASGTGRWNFYAAGTADNFFGGSVAIGGTTTPSAAGQTLRIGANMTGLSNEWAAVVNNGQVRSGVTSTAYMYRSTMETQATAFTLTNFYYNHTSQSSIGAGSAVTNQYGYFAESTMTGATNNYGFYGNIASGTGRYNLYMAGTAANYFGGQIQLNQDYVEKTYSATVTTTNTLDLTNGTVQIITLTASTACTFTMPTATAGKSFVLLLKQAATTGNGTATFTSVKWGTSGAPTITATAGKMDILTFIADGTNWYGSIAQGYTP